MSRFINRIHINKLFHLNNLDITIEDENNPHLIITGKNGSGKTILLNAIADFLDNVKDDNNLSYLALYERLASFRKAAETTTVAADKLAFRNAALDVSNRIDKIFGKVSVDFDNPEEVARKYHIGDFIFAYYQATREIKGVLKEPKSPTKPSYKKNGKIKETSTSQFLNFLSDLKIQEALARNEQQINDANEIGAWFKDFEHLLQKIFQDDNLKLEFNYKDYGFFIFTNEKKFKFTEVSDGFSAVLDIVADLILKMQEDGLLLRNYQKEGVVLIDEIETHLHLGLQKIVMPFLTKTFPNIQFIVTTHSPFVLSSMPNAVAYDLEHRENLYDLTDYSYESLAEGYFGVKTPSSYAEMQLNNLQALLEKEDWSDSDKIEIKQLTSDFDKIPETISPLIVGEYRQLAVKYANRIKEL